MTLIELRDTYRDAFNQNQNWFDGEPFMYTNPAQQLREPWAVVVGDAREAPELAVNLAHLYIANPKSPIWLRYIWCADRDSLGQQVYVGVNNGKFEIHRHIHITERFGVPVWD